MANSDTSSGRSRNDTSHYEFNEKEKVWEEDHKHTYTSNDLHVINELRPLKYFEGEV